jgi:vancomycin resistance protein YoaR
LDKTTLASLVQDLEKKEDNEVAIPAELVPAKLTTKDISAKLFKNVLHSWSTLFFTNTPINLNRAQNIRLAVGKVNGKILAPGDVFSFNETVGPRTEAAGFKDAYIFVKGEMVEGTGGGICQVTSTLYNAVLFSDLEVVERRNHMFAVTYTPPGRDATVAYGSVDFRFRNNTEWPLRIDARVTKDNKIIFALVGTDENPGKTVEVYQKIIKETDFTIKYKDDPTLPEGTTVVTHNGMKGYVVDTYKLVKENGKVISDKKIHRSVYTPQPQEVSRGTMKVKDPAVDVPATTVPGDSAPVDVNPPATDVNPPADSSQDDAAPLE